MKKIFLSILLSVCTIAVFSQNEISYNVSFPNAIHHEAEITMTVPSITAGSLTVRMARASPGRYATHEFGKNIYNVKAVGADGKSLTLKQVEADVYQIVNPGKQVKVSYTIYGNWMDGTYSGFDRAYAHMSMPATFMFPVGYDARPRLLNLNYADKPFWKVATQLKPMGGNKYYARDFQYFMDSPTELADYKSSNWEVTDKTGSKQTIHHIAISADSQATIDNYAEMLKKMVQEHLAVWGEFPKYDYGNYYFLHSNNPENAGDGMEHRNSTVIVQRTEKIEGNELGLLSTFSHEYFHSWNVERLRPKTLEPFNFTHSNVSDGLWMAEGFTQYYGALLLKRAGFRTLEQCIQGFNGIVNTVLNAPGALNYSPIEASKYAVFADAGVAIDQTNKANIFTSYYTYGASVALALDLRLRADYKLTLDDYMRALWAAYGRPEIPYNVSDLQKTLGTLTKDPAFADNFFKQYVYGTAKNDYAALLSNAGLVLRKANPGKAYSGLGRISVERDKAVVSTTLKGSPAYLAGLDVGDVLLKVAGETIKSQADLNKVTAAHKPGDKIQITYVHRGISYNTELVLSEDPDLEIVTMEKAGETPNATMLDFRNKWLNTQIK